MICLSTTVLLRVLDLESRLQHAVDNQELKDSFKNLYLDEDADGAAGTAGSSGAGAGAGLFGSGTSRAAGN